MVLSEKWEGIKTMSEKQLTVAELLAKAGREGEGGGEETPRRRRRRSVDSGGVSVAENPPNPGIPAVRLTRKKPPILAHSVRLHLTRYLAIRRQKLGTSHRFSTTMVISARMVGGRQNTLTHQNRQRPCLSSVKPTILVGP